VLLKFQRIAVSKTYKGTFLMLHPAVHSLRIWRLTQRSVLCFYIQKYWARFENIKSRCSFGSRPHCISISHSSCDCWISG